MILCSLDQDCNKMSLMCYCVSQRRHVPTDLNCADDATRGLHAKVLTNEHRWFSGPRFLYEHEDDWPQGKCVVHEERSHECLTEIVKPKMTFALEVSQPLMNPLKFTSWNRQESQRG